MERETRHHPLMQARGGRWLGVVSVAPLAAVLLTPLAGCGPSSKPATPSQAPPANSAPAPNVQATTLSLPPAPDPEHDPRPDRIKFADFTDRLEKVQADLVRVDSALIPRVRAALQSGDQAGAKAALADYRAQVAADVAAQPPPPRLAGCFSSAQALGVKLEAVLAQMLSQRQAQAGAIASVADRPLTLADFGGLAADITNNLGVDVLKDGIASARRYAESCRVVAGAATSSGRVKGREQSGERISVQIISPPPPPLPEGHAPPPPSPKKRTLFERMFGGGS